MISSDAEVLHFINESQWPSSRSQLSSQVAVAAGTGLEFYQIELSFFSAEIINQYLLDGRGNKAKRDSLLCCIDRQDFSNKCHWHLFVQLCIYKTTASPIGVEQFPLCRRRDITGLDSDRRRNVRTALVEMYG